MLNHFKTQILRDMGIDIWRLRPPGWTADAAAGVGASLRQETPERSGSETLRGERESNHPAAATRDPAAIGETRSSVHADSAFSALREALPGTPATASRTPAATGRKTSTATSESVQAQPEDLVDAAVERFELSLTCFLAGGLLIVADTQESNDDDLRFLRDVARAARSDWSKSVEQFEFVWPQSRIDTSRPGAVKALGAMIDKYRSRGVVKLVCSAAEQSSAAVLEVGFDTESFPAVSALRRNVADKRRLWRLIQVVRL